MNWAPSPWPTPVPPPVPLPLELQYPAGQTEHWFTSSLGSPGQWEKTSLDFSTLCHLLFGLSSSKAFPLQIPSTFHAFPLSHFGKTLALDEPLSLEQRTLLETIHWRVNAAGDTALAVFSGFPPIDKCAPTLIATWPSSLTLLGACFATLLGGHRNHLNTEMIYVCLPS